MLPTHNLRLPSTLSFLTERFDQPRLGSYTHPEVYDIRLLNASDEEDEMSRQDDSYKRHELANRIVELRQEIGTLASDLHQAVVGDPIDLPPAEMWAIASRLSNKMVRVRSALEEMAREKFSWRDGEEMSQRLYLRHEIKADGFEFLRVQFAYHESEDDEGDPDDYLLISIDPPTKQVDDATEYIQGWGQNPFVFRLLAPLEGTTSMASPFDQRGHDPLDQIGDP